MHPASSSSASRSSPARLCSGSTAPTQLGALADSRGDSVRGRERPGRSRRGAPGGLRGPPRGCRRAPRRRPAFPGLGQREGISLVADGMDGIVGHAMFTPNLLDAPQQLVPVSVLSPVGVLPRHQRQGVGSAIVRRGLEFLTERPSVPVVFLEGIAVVLRTLRIRTGCRSRISEALVANPRRCVPGAPRPPLHEPWMTGTLVYSEIFWRHDACRATGLMSTRA